MFFEESIIFLFSSGITFVLVLSQHSSNTLLGIIAFLLLALFLLSRFIFSGIKGRVRTKIFQNGILFLSALFFQTLTLSTGGFYSHFLILIYLYSLGASFLLNMRAALSFLIFSVSILMAHILLDPKLTNIFLDDPWTIVLYIISFIVFIPLASVIFERYSLKDTISKLLSQHIKIGERREAAILLGLSEPIFVTNTDLITLSINNTAEKMLHLSAENVVGKPLFNVVHLVDDMGTPANIQSLSLDQILIDKATRIVQGFHIMTPDWSQSNRITIQIRPVVDPDGKLSQIVFVITDAQKISLDQIHRDLDKARQKRKEMLQEMESLISSVDSPKLKAEAELFSKMEDDFLETLEIEDHLIDKSWSLEDVVELCKKNLETKQSDALKMGVTLQFSSPLLGHMANANQNSGVSPSQTYYVVLVDRKWFDILLGKLLDIAILIASNQTNKTVQLSVENKDDAYFYIFISLFYPPLSPEDQQSLFEPYYGKLGQKTNLCYGSGLEGLIAKKIAGQLNIPLTVKYDSKTSLLLFALQTSKGLQ